METTDCQLHATISECRGGGIQARLVELGISARGENQEDLLKELGHALTVTYRVAKELGETPFVKFIQRDAWSEPRSESSTPFGIIEVPDEVGAAIAAVLHLLRPSGHIFVYSDDRKAA